MLATSRSSASFSFDHFLEDELLIRLSDGVWAHGDFCMITPERRGVIMLGRSDGVLNRQSVPPSFALQC